MSTSNPFEPRVSFHASSISDTALVGLRRLTIDRVLPAAGEFGTWLHSWIDREQARRQTGQRPAGLTSHDVALPPAGDWSNRELADALTAVTALSYCGPDSGRDLALGQFIDRLALLISEVAASRLRGNP